MGDDNNENFGANNNFDNTFDPNSYDTNANQFKNDQASAFDQFGNPIDPDNSIMYSNNLNSVSGDQLYYNSQNVQDLNTMDGNYDQTSFADYQDPTNAYPQYDNTQFDSDPNSNFIPQVEVPDENYDMNANQLPMDGMDDSMASQLPQDYYDNTNQLPQDGIDNLLDNQQLPQNYYENTNQLPQDGIDTVSDNSLPQDFYDDGSQFAQEGFDSMNGQLPLDYSSDASQLPQDSFDGSMNNQFDTLPDMDANPVNNFETDGSLINIPMDDNNYAVDQQFAYPNADNFNQATDVNDQNNAFYDDSQFNQMDANDGIYDPNAMNNPQEFDQPIQEDQPINGGDAPVSDTPVSGSDVSTEYASTWMTSLYEKANSKKFNWCAFLFGPIYYFYRKVYLQGFLLAIINTLMTILLGTIGIKTDNLTLSCILIGVTSLIFSVIYGLLFNSIYKSNVSKNYEKNNTIEYAQKNGGTTVVGIILGVILLGCLSSLSGITLGALGLTDLLSGFIPGGNVVTNQVVNTVENTVENTTNTIVTPTVRTRTYTFADDEYQVTFDRDTWTLDATDPDEFILTYADSSNTSIQKFKGSNVVASINLACGTDRRTDQQPLR